MIVMMTTRPAECVSVTQRAASSASHLAANHLCSVRPLYLLLCSYLSVEVLLCCTQNTMFCCKCTERKIALKRLYGHMRWMDLEQVGVLSYCAQSSSQSRVVYHLKRKRLLRKLVEININIVRRLFVDVQSNRKRHKEISMIK